MPRTTGEQVAAIIETEEEISLTPFIEVANAVVTEICAGKLRSDGVTLYYDATRLELIERWLSAHFYAIRDMRRASESVSTVREVFQYKVGLHFDVTVYGQQAMLLDTAGGLASLQAQVQSGKPRVVASLSWLGTSLVGEAEGEDGE